MDGFSCSGWLRLYGTGEGGRRNLSRNAFITAGLSAGTDSLFKSDGKEHALIIKEKEKTTTLVKVWYIGHVQLVISKKDGIMQ